MLKRRPRALRGRAYSGAASAAGAQASARARGLRPCRVGQGGVQPRLQIRRDVRQAERKARSVGAVDQRPFARFDRIARDAVAVEIHLRQAGLRLGKVVVRSFEDEAGAFQLQARGTLRIRLLLADVEQAEAEIVLREFKAVAALRQPAQDRNGFLALSGQPQILGPALGVGRQSRLLRYPVAARIDRLVARPAAPHLGRGGDGQTHRPPPGSQTPFSVSSRTVPPSPPHLSGRRRSRHPAVAGRNQTTRGPPPQRQHRAASIREIRLGECASTTPFCARAATCRHDVIYAAEVSRKQAIGLSWKRRPPRSGYS